MPRKNRTKPHVRFQLIEGSCKDKVRFVSKQAAMAAIADAARLQPLQKMRAYQCLQCSGWHLTSSKTTQEQL